MTGGQFSAEMRNTGASGAELRPFSPPPPPESFPAPQARVWLGPTASVAATFAIIVTVLGGTAIETWRGTPAPLRFFDPRRSPTFDETCVVSTIDYALSSAEDNDVVFLGDSACRTGIDPVLFERLTGLRAYNLGIVGDLGPGVMLNVAGAYLATHRAPRLIVLCLSPVGLERDVPWYWTKLRNHVENCYGFDVHDARSLQANLSYTLRQGTLFACAKSGLFLASDLPDVRDWPLVGMEKVTYRQFEPLSREKRGHCALPGRGPFKNLDRPGGIVVIHEAWNAGARRLIKTCDNARIPLLIRFCPVSAEATRNINFERPERWLMDLKASFPRLLLPADPPIVRFEPMLCWDYSHANPQGTRRFTELVAAEVRSALEPGAVKAKGK
jgi:hypothetical protein